MPKVLLAGLEPETVDFTDPAIPPGMDAAMIRMGIELAVQSCKARGRPFLASLVAGVGQAYLETEGQLLLIIGRLCRQNNVSDTGHRRHPGWRGTSPCGAKIPALLDSHAQEHLENALNR